MNRPPQLRAHRRGGFTLIELLTVIEGIAILMGLPLACHGRAGVEQGADPRVGAERDAIITAIQRYKQDKGFYPPDSPGNPVKNVLFYELTGMVANFNPPNPAPISVSPRR